MPEPINRPAGRTFAEAPWLAAAQDLAAEIYGGKLNMREVPTDTFVQWYLWRLDAMPNTDAGIPLKDFDIESAMMFFEDDVKAANDQAHLSAPCGRVERNQKEQ